MNATRSLLGALALLVASTLPCSRVVAAAPVATAQWQELFNGRDLTGWTPVHEVDFRVQEGNLRLVKGMGWLRTQSAYKDFIFEFEWRALEEQYDSGVFLRAGLEGKPWPKDGWQVNLSYKQVGGLVKGYKTIVPAETPKMPVNQWVKFRIEVRGSKVKLIVNGEDAWETDQLDAKEGYLGIQAENKAFEFRHLRVLPL